MIAANGSITLIMPHAEVGQGIYTSSAMLIAEELEMGLDQVAVQPAPPDLKKYLDPLLFDQATGGSTSTRSDWRRLREAGAAARLMLLAAAARRWDVDPGDCRAERGAVHHDASGRALAYSELAADAAREAVPQRIALKDPSQFRLIGTSAKRLADAARQDPVAFRRAMLRDNPRALGVLNLAAEKAGWAAPCLQAPAAGSACSSRSAAICPASSRRA